MLSEGRSFLRVVGSLWFAVVILILLMVALASGTVFESQNGRERVLAGFYHATWFKSLLAIFAVNVLAAVALRWPFSRARVGFLLTHGGLAVLLIGSLLTASFGLRGQVAIFEGESVSSYHAPEETLTIRGRGGLNEESIDLDPSVFGGFSSAENPDVPAPTLGEIEELNVVRYLPDMVWEEVVEDDSPAPSPAVEVLLTAGGEEGEPVWIFAGKHAAVGGVDGTLLTVAEPGELARLLGSPEAEDPDTVGVVKLEYRGESYEIPVEECLDEALPLGDTELRVHALQYFPHATVGPDNEVLNTSSEPVNPALGLEITGPEGSETRVLFALFPDYVMARGTRHFEELEATFVSSAPPLPTAPIEVIRGPDDELHVRFYWAGTRVTSHRIEAGETVETPWPGRLFSVRRLLEHARIRLIAREPEHSRKERVPAMLVEIKSGGIDRKVWLQRGTRRTVTFEGTSLELLYGDKVLPLGFEIELEDFRLGYYPGGERIRSYESHVIISDPGLGGERRHVISMNHPLDHGGYTLFQTGYKEVEGRQVTFLELSRDPGQWVAFLGFILTGLGMMVTFSTRVKLLRRGPQVRVIDQTGRAS